MIVVAAAAHPESNELFVSFSLHLRMSAKCEVNLFVSASMKWTN